MNKFRCGFPTPREVSAYGLQAMPGSVGLQERTLGSRSADSRAAKATLRSYSYGRCSRSFVVLMFFGNTYHDYTYSCI